MYFITRYIKMMRNPFWVDVLAAWVSLNNNMTINTPTEFLSQRVWNNYLFQMDRHTVNILAFLQPKVLLRTWLLWWQEISMIMRPYVTTLGLKVLFLHFGGLRRAILSASHPFQICQKSPMPIRPLVYAALGL